MTIWLIRGGSHGEYEQKFIRESRVYLTWGGLNVNIAALGDRADLAKEMANVYPNAKPKAIQNWVSQTWRFTHDIKIGDLVILPLKTQRTIYVGEVISAYHAQPKGPDPFYHWRSVKWIAESLPRTHFGKDLLYSFGAFLTVCQIKNNNAEQRILAMQKSGWRPETISATISPAISASDSEEETADIDPEELARDQIAKLIEARFKGHGLARLVEGILKAQGYTTYLSPEGADGGADILAGTGPLGFGSPRLCVEVKSGSGPVDGPTVQKLMGAVKSFGANEGLFVSWGGFNGNAQKELARQFFSIRLWTQAELMEQLFVHYDQLDEDLKAELPLKRIWAVTIQEDGPN